MRKFPENAVLERYNRVIQKKPLHEKLETVSKASREKIRRCLSAAAPDELVKLYAEAGAKVTAEMGAYEAGRINYFLDETEEALRLLKDAYEQGDKRAAIYLGKILLAKGDDAKGAIPFLTDAAEREEEEAFGLSGKVYEKQHDVLKAIEFYRKELERGIFDHACRLGQLYEQAGKMKNASEVYEKAFLNNRPEAIGFLMTLHLDMGDYKQFMRKFLLGLDWRNRSNVYFMQAYYFFQGAKANREEKKMLKGLERMKDIVIADSCDLWILLVEILVEEGKLDQAAGICKSLIRQRKNACNKLAAIELMRGNFDKAMKACEDGIKRKEPLCHYYLGSIHDRGGREEEAIEQFKLAAGKRDERAYLALASIYERRGEQEEAKKNYLYAIKGRDRKKAIIPALSFVLKNCGFIEAGDVLKEALKCGVADKEILALLPKDRSTEVQLILMFCAGKGLLRAHLILGKYFLLINDLEAAEEQLRVAIQKGFKEARLLLAECFQRAGKYAHARNEFKNALREKIDCYIGFASCLKKSGYPEEAAVCYRMAIDMGHDEAFEKLIPLLVALNKLQEAQILMDLAHRKKIPLKGMFEHFEKTGKTGINTDQKEIPRDELN